MTGFGASQRELSGTPPLSVEVEVRSVNNRGLKVSLRHPESLASLAPQLEGLVRKLLSRGSVFMQVRLQRQALGGGYRFDSALCLHFYRQLSVLARQLGEPNPSLAEVAQLPGVVRELEPVEDQEQVQAAALAAAEAALQNLIAMRCTEGQGIQAELLRLVDAIDADTEVVATQAPLAVEASAERMRARIEQLMEGQELDPRELAREVALLADKCDIAEELQRLRSHTAQLRKVVQGAQGPVGRKLEFLAQELVREANTMANKSHDPALVERVLGIKLSVERIREQLANVE